MASFRSVQLLLPYLRLRHTMHFIPPRVWICPFYTRPSRNQVLVCLIQQIWWWSMVSTRQILFHGSSKTIPPTSYGLVNHMNSKLFKIKWKNIINFHLPFFTLPCPSQILWRHIIERKKRSISQTFIAGVWDLELTLICLSKIFTRLPSVNTWHM